jgi:lysylphosphatidylglycerol synthetase-like protein (DUF2156 family)
MRGCEMTAYVQATEAIAPRPLQTALACAAIMAAVAVVLFSMGRIPVCACGTVKLWHGVVNSAENSQHLFDWYTPSHIIHGFLFFGLFALIRRFTDLVLPLTTALLIALALEGLWEIAENTPDVIERYRSATISLGYNGDSIINSVADMLSMIAGFLLASRLPVAVSVALVAGAELLVGWLIRDNFILNVIMLVWPMDWQSGLSQATQAKIWG